MHLPLRVPPDSVTEPEVARNVLPRDRTSAVTALFEEHYASLVRMARLLVDDRETAEDVVMDAFTSLRHATRPIARLWSLPKASSMRTAASTPTEHSPI